MILEEGCFGNHHAITESTEMYCVAHFLCEDIARIDLSWNMGYIAAFSLVSLADTVLAKVQVFDAFGSAGGSPVNTGLVVIVDRSRGLAVNHTEVKGPKFDRINFLNAFVGCQNFSFTRAEGGMVLADRFPRDRPP